MPTPKAKRESVERNSVMLYIRTHRDVRAQLDAIVAATGRPLTEVADEILRRGLGMKTKPSLSEALRAASAKTEAA